MSRDTAPHITTDQDERILTANHRPGRKVPDIVVRGMHEREILSLAPARVCDRVHWDTVEPFDIVPLVRELGPNAWTRQWSDGQHRIWVPEGHGFQARAIVREWSQARGIEVVNLRVEPKVPFRDLDSIRDGLVPDLVAACVDWLFPRSFAVRRKLATELELVDDEDVRSLMYLFVHDHADRYDADRTGRNGTLNFTAFMFGKLRTWPQDASRTAFGRTVVGDRIALHRANERALHADGREATEGERATALGVSVTELRRREDAIATLRSMRTPRTLVVGEPDADEIDAVQAVSPVDVAEEGIEFVQQAAITRAVVDAVTGSAAAGKRTEDPLGLAALYLTFWEGLTRADVARHLDILPKTASAALQRALERIAPASVA